MTNLGHDLVCQKGARGPGANAEYLFLLYKTQETVNSAYNATLAVLFPAAGRQRLKFNKQLHIPAMSSWLLPCECPRRDRTVSRGGGGSVPPGGVHAGLVLTPEGLGLRV